MYLKDGRKIIESDEYPGYFIDQSNGAWCDEEGNYVGGIADDGDAPGRGQTAILDVPDTVYTSKTGKYYFSKPCKTAKIPMDKGEADRKGLKPSAEYNKFVLKLYNQWQTKKYRGATKTKKKK